MIRSAVARYSPTAGRSPRWSAPPASEMSVPSVSFTRWANSLTCSASGLVPASGIGLLGLATVGLDRFAHDVSLRSPVLVGTLAKPLRLVVGQGEVLDHVALALRCRQGVFTCHPVSDLYGPTGIVLPRWV